MVSNVAPPPYTPSSDIPSDGSPSIQHTPISEKPRVANEPRLSSEIEIKAIDDAKVDSLASSIGHVVGHHDRLIDGTETGVTKNYSSCQTQRGCCCGRPQGHPGCQGPIGWAVAALFTAAKRAHEKHQAEKNKRTEAVKAELYVHSRAAHDLERGAKNERSALLDDDHQIQGLPCNDQIAVFVQLEERIRREGMSCCQAKRARWAVIQQDERRAGPVGKYDKVPSKEGKASYLASTEEGDERDQETVGLWMLLSIDTYEWNKIVL
ncbi:MAG: hypothetical protein M1835_006876 [Candelina submexicana]|nr:MAG: hypothetical protein M1835_006876 [Candelina submexicana]